jgi:exodeoxyribonuclease VII small subunit
MNMEKQPKSYSEAIAEVETILARFGDGTLDVDTLAAQVKRATELIAWCKQRLTKAEKDVAEALDGGGNAHDGGNAHGDSGYAPRTQ